MASTSKHLERTLIKEEVEKVRSWILDQTDAVETEEPRNRGGGLHIHCAEQQSKDWMGAQMKVSKPWEGATCRFLYDKYLPKPL